MQWIFKKYKTGEQYNFLYVSGHKSPENPATADRTSFSVEEPSGNLIKQKFDTFLAFASTLTEVLKSLPLYNLPLP